MAEIYSSLQRLVIPRMGQRPTAQGGLREWLVKGTYAASHDPSSGHVVLQNISPDNLIAYLSHDYERFALASLESFRSFALESDELNLVSWPLLKLYYSAFFAAHAISRATGMSIVKVERAQTDMLNQIVLLTAGTSPGLKPGMYQARVEQVLPGQLQLSLVPHVDGSGVHDGFWKSFTDYLEALAEDAVQRNLSDASLFVAGVSEIAPRTRGWLSARRNDINYQQLFGVWYPLLRGKSLNGRVRSVRRIDSRMVNLSEPLSSQLNAFITTCQYLSCLGAEVGDYIAARSTSKAAFGARWRRFSSTFDKAAA